jgi:hypothetical protein
MLDAPGFAFHTLGQMLLGLALGAAVMILLALAAERLLAQAAMRRMLWQAVLLGLGGLLVFELSGAAHAVSALLEISTQSVTTRPGSETNEVDAHLPSGSREPPCAPFHTEHVSLQDEMAELPIQERAAWEWVMPRSPEPAESEVILQEPAGTPVAVLSKVPRPATSGSAAAPPILAVRGLVLLWAAGVCFFAGRAVLARLRLIRLRQRWTPSDDPELHRLVDDLRERMGMKRPVRLRLTAGLSTPVAFGMIRPTVLLPADFSKRFSLPQQQVIMAHELAHLAAKDPVWLFAGELIAALLWWHPLVHLARRRLLAASEQAADAASTLLPNGPDVLADCLVKLGRCINGRSRLGWVAAEGSGLRSGLARRVQRLLKLNETVVPFPASRVSMAARPVAVVLLMVLTISCTLWVHPKASLAKGEVTMNVLRVSWRQSLAVAALTAFLGPLATDVAAGDAPAAPPRPAQLDAGSPADQLLLAQEGDREHREGEARGDRERRGGEVRGDREQGDRQRGEREAGEDRPRREGQRDAEHREGESRERAQRDRGEQPERMERRREEIRHRIEQLEREKAELHEQSGRAARELEEALRKTKEETAAIDRRVGELERKLAASADDPKGLAELSKELEKVRDVRAELSKRAENLNREMAEHRTNVQRRMAELERAFAEIREQQARIEAESARENPERAEIMKRFQEIAKKAAELQQAGKQEEAQRLQQEMRELRARLAAPGDPHRPGPRGPREGVERLEAMERELGKLRETGRHDAAEQLERELKELRRRLETPREGERPGPPPELQVRIDHLRVAMENLHAAGLHDQAEQIAQQIDRATREHAIMRGTHAPGPPQRRDPDARPRGPRPEGPPERAGEIVGQLRGEIEQLRRENEELRQMMNEIRQAQERLVNELRERR